MAARSDVCSPGRAGSLPLASWGWGRGSWLRARLAPGLRYLVVRIRRPVTMAYAGMSFQDPTGGAPDGRRSIAAALTLLERMGRHAWLARAGDGSLVTARYMSIAGTGQASDACALVEHAGKLASPYLVPVLGAVQREGAVWLVSDLDRGISVGCLLRLAGLSPRQAVVLAADMFAGLDHLHAGGQVHGRLHPGSIHLAAGDEVRLSDWSLAALEDATLVEDRRRADLEAAARVTGRLVTAVRRPSGCGDDGAVALLAALRDAAARAGFGAPAGAVAASLEDALGAGSAGALGRRDLSALVAAVPPGVRLRLPVGTSVTSDVAAQAAASRQRSAPLSGRARVRVLQVSSALVVLAAVVGLEYAFLRGQIVRDVHVLAGRSPVGLGTMARGAGHPAGHTPARAPMIAPATAGPIIAVDLRALRPCVPGAACSLRTLVQVREHATLLRVRWTLTVADRCSGTRLTRPGDEALVPPGDNRVTAVGSTLLPAGRSLAVIAVTDAPARVAGPPLAVPAAGGSC